MAYIKKLNINGTTYPINDANALKQNTTKINWSYGFNTNISSFVIPITYAGTCTTSASTAVKLFNTGWDGDTFGELPDGTLVCIKYTYTNTATGTPYAKFSARGGFTYNFWYGNAVLTESASPYAGVADTYILYMIHGSYLVYLGMSKDSESQTITIDSTITQSSTNPVTSAAIYSSLAAKADSSSLATVATSGSYSDLSNTPTIDSTITQNSTNAVQSGAVYTAIGNIETLLSNI